MATKLTVIAGIAALLVGCVPKNGLSQEEETQLSHMHRLYNAENFDGIYSMTTPEFRRSFDTSTFKNTMGRLHQSMGAVTRTETRGVTVEYFPIRRTAVIETSFERGTASEMLTFDSGDPPRLMHYSVSITSVYPSQLPSSFGSLTSASQP